MRFIHTTLFSLSLLIVTGLSGAQSDGDERRARELFEAGMGAAERDELGAAIRSLTESYRLFAHPGTLNNLAVFQHRTGLRVEAYRSFRELLERYGAVISPQARDEARQRIQELSGFLAIIEVSSTPLGATILVDDEDHGVTPLRAPIVLDPGRHFFEALLDGYQRTRLERQLVPGANTTVELRLPADSEAMAVNDESTSDEAQPRAVLFVESSTPDARVSVDDQPSQPAPLRMDLEPGEHEVLIEAPGHIAQRRRVRLAEEGEAHIVIELVRIVRDESPPVAERERSRFWRGPWPWIIGGALVVGATATALAVALPEDGSSDIMTLEIR
jgi:hypothetical protein